MMRWAAITTTIKISYNRKTERSVAQFSHPHDLKLTWIWELPVGKGGGS